MIDLNGQTRGRGSIFLRVLAGTLGAYGLTSLATVALSLLLVGIGMNRVEAVTAAALASFVIFAVVAMAVFHAPSAVHAWRWLLAFAVPLALAILAVKP
ncbi:hypothetical protein K3M67_19420 (plasmid) [Sphingobium sp. V4]|uniref:hypothetical protein n=1 Tax=Sphingobium sp. V4 TaxID=3038927 RepID=UPI002557D330|nr:hypothetical protein [Sphingobium sp. V4]WIW90225.1 hypothetical protein K3M67_19420 [Sphingobium sp. V4]